MSKDSLDSLSDAELSARVAVKCAGCTELAELRAESAERERFTQALAAEYIKLTEEYVKLHCSICPAEVTNPKACAERDPLVRHAREFIKGL